ncbi:hypothetical protein BUALT_Bualt05G0060900 [Buddleja alternifolia]|uniref:DUF4005 domain-containing protein n=1 Tax=Buddleja alternifolia TaxID=168488 RepID=A0AAV6XSW1_9LAMI|nr:hypothetical protein BUALT_Bualt05G0060900 [Buddleja alternifolia]
MGKASKWFRGLLGLKKPDPNPPNPSPKPPPKKKWGFAKPHKERDSRKSQHGVVPGGVNDDHAVRVATATAAVADAAVVKLTNSGRNTYTLGSGGGFHSAACVRQGGAGYGKRVEWAAVMIQSHFRAYLSRRALRALKALVKLQALVRGHILRKQTADILRQMQALVRAQARARAGRVLASEATHSSIKSSHHFIYTAPTTPEKFEHIIRARDVKNDHLKMLKRNGSRSSGSVIYDQEKSRLSRHQTDRKTGERSWEQGSYTRIFPTDDERSDKILEVDTGKPKHKNLLHSSNLSHTSDHYHPSFSTSKDSTARQTTILSPSPDEVRSLSPFKKNYAQDLDGSVFCTAENSPLFYSASSMGGSSKRGPFTPTKSDGSRSCLSGYSDHPNYMAYTESSKAKVRSLSAPKQRPPQYERSSSVNRYSVHGYGESRSNAAQKVSALHANFMNKAYPGSGRLDGLGMPVRGDIAGYSGGHWIRY